MVLIVHIPLLFDVMGWEDTNPIGGKYSIQFTPNQKLGSARASRELCNPRLMVCHICINRAQRRGNGNARDGAHRARRRSID